MPIVQTTSLPVFDIDAASAKAFRMEGQSWIDVRISQIGRFALSLPLTGRIPL